VNTSAVFADERSKTRTVPTGRVTAKESVWVAAGAATSLEMPVVGS
jgi:hypothetical protein